MKLLVLGGTVFLGRHIVEKALTRGHQVTLFNRGQSNSDLFPGVQKLRGDRNGGLASLEGQRWDAVVDTCGYVPRLVRDSAEMLADAVDHYTYVSTISVYTDFSRPGIDENSPLGRLGDDTVEEVDGKTYGPLKALCEQAAEAAMPGRVLNVRPGLIVGPHDPTDRFTYWPSRMARGGEILAPGLPEDPVQIIDVRDLARWVIEMIEKLQVGVYNATGPDYHLTMRQSLESCLEAAGSTGRLTWVDDSFLLEAKVEPWTGLPLWLPGEEYAGLMAVSIEKALAAGLAFRPLRETARDTLKWAESRPAGHEWRGGLDQERERALLEAWHKRF